MMSGAHIKHRAMAFLVDERRQTRQAPYTVNADVTAMRMAKRLGVPPHDLIHVLWDLQKRDLIRFRERKYSRGGVGGRGELDHFVITGAGFAFWRDMQQGEAVLALASTEPGDVPDVTASLEAQRIASDIATERPAKGNGHVDVPAFMSNIRGEPDGGGADPSSPTPAPALDPLLVGVLARYRARERVREAAAALEAAGLEDQALIVMEQVGDNAVEDAMARHLIGCPHAVEPGVG